jgi:hypothetical protein
MNLSYSTDYLLKLSRFPERFYNVIYTDKEWLEAFYSNPGRAIRSYLVAKALNQEIITLNETVAAEVEECEKFCADPYILESVFQTISNTAGLLCDRLYDLPDPVLNKAMHQHMAKIGKLVEIVDARRSHFVHTHHTTTNHIEAALSVEGNLFKQAIYDLSDATDAANEQLDQLSPTQKA